MNLLFKSLGILICGLVALRSLVYLLRAISQLLAESQLRRLRILLLQEEIAAIRATRKSQSKQVTAWDGWRKFRVADKRQECPGCCSIYLVPHDGQPLPEFQPGQYLTFRLSVPGREKKVVRCYSLSDRFYDDHYRVTIKKVLSTNAVAGRLAWPAAICMTSSSRVLSWTSVHLEATLCWTEKRTSPSCCSPAASASHP